LRRQTGFWFSADEVGIQKIRLSGYFLKEAKAVPIPIGIAGIPIAIGTGEANGMN